MTKAERNKPHSVSVRLTDELYAILEAATQQYGPYELSKATIIERGIVLAVAELEDFKLRHRHDQSR